MTVQKLAPTDLAPSATDESAATSGSPRSNGEPPQSNDARASAGPLVADRFAILGLIGVGGMGSVYRARDVTLDETVALKVIAREIAREPGMLERFRREVRLARRVTHPNVARCFDIGQDRNDCFFTMELIEGESLRARLDREGRVTPAATIAIATEVCAGLGAAHRAGVVHRDLKPDNVMLGNDGRVVLTDFGIASARLPNDRGQATVGTVVGTPEYISPEQVEGARDIDGRADIYSLGVMLFELVTGRAPWTGSTPLAIVVARLGAEPPDPRRFVALDDGLADIILRCMAPRREARFDSVDDVARALYEVYVPGTGEHRVTTVAPGAVVGRGNTERPAQLSIGAQHQKTVTVVTSSDDEDELALAVADGLGDLIERQLRSATHVRVAARDPSQSWRRRGESPRTTGTPAANAGGSALVVDAKVVIVGRSVSADVKLVNSADGVELSSRHYTGARAGLFGIAARVARDVAEKLMAPYRQTLPVGIQDVESLDLWLRARFEQNSGAPLALDRAVALFERAMARVPDEPWLLAAYATTLVDRFVETAGSSSDLAEAVGMAERVLASTEVLGEGWLARGLARFELGDPNGALADVARAGSIVPGLARAHAVRGRLLRETRLTRRANAHLERALELQPWSTEAQLELALGSALAGAFDDANARIAHLAGGRRSTPEGALLASRFALWSGDLRAARDLRAQLDSAATLARREPCFYVLDAALGTPAQDGVDYFSWLAEDDPIAARRSATAREVQAELAAASGDLARAMEAVDLAARTAGFCDLAWLEGCPLLVSLRDTPRFSEVRERVGATARVVTETLDATKGAS